uniref:Cytochrome c oxidase subunit 2 n=1 Tax=Obrimoposthia wandeli TaxID=2136291 RepID=A0A7D6C6L2_9PLAT|nr:cytochrome c oxidase subunit II [Obrimoposthia wandeli]QLJ92323.1 cytochrome oxidase subunit 2 [Obrimoposthia wandeli]
MGYIDSFHDHGMFVVVLIAFLVLVLIVAYFFISYFYLDYIEDSGVEVVWTVLPGIILLSLAIPSLRLLYLTDFPSIENPVFTLKCTGYQWYWGYGVISSDSTLEYDSYMSNVSSLVNLGVDNSINLPFDGSLVRLLVGSNDVIHSFAIPQLGVKLDGVPGRLNQSFFSLNNYGSFYGQCSEICGANHSFMPINLNIA